MENIKTIAFFDAKPYDRKWFDKLASEYGYEIKYYENKLTFDTALLAKGADAVVAFVNDDIGRKTIDALYRQGNRVIAMRSAGYNNVDIRHAFEKIHILRVPAYSPHAVAEYAMALLLTLVRKTHRAYDRTREHNFSISGPGGHKPLRTHSRHNRHRQDRPHIHGYLQRVRHGCDRIRPLSRIRLRHKLCVF